MKYNYQQAFSVAEAYLLVVGALQGSEEVQVAIVLNPFCRATSVGPDLARGLLHWAAPSVHSDSFRSQVACRGSYASTYAASCYPVGEKVQHLTTKSTQYKYKNNQEIEKKNAYFGRHIYVNTENYNKTCNLNELISCSYYMCCINGKFYHIIYCIMIKINYFFS